jgi:hypothetical protein
MSRRLLALCVVFAGSGCLAGPMLVRDVRVDGHDLVFEKCPVASSWSGCTTQRRRLPEITYVTAERTTVPNERARSLAQSRKRVTSCAEQFHVTGVVRLKLTLDVHGRVTAVEPDLDNADFATCARTAFASATFSEAQWGHTVELVLQVAAPPEAP